VATPLDGALSSRLSSRRFSSLSTFKRFIASLRHILVVKPEMTTLVHRLGRPR
jgi:hypothetical protein